MAKTNFQFEKRQKELEKKRKNEEKLKRKLNKGVAQPEDAATDEQPADQATRDPAADPIAPA